MQLRYLVFPAFLIVCFLVFMGTASYGYVTDYLGWLNSYRDGSYKDVLHCFGYPGNHQFFHLINYTLYLLIGKHQWAMGVVFILSHASLCYLIYRTFRYLMEMLGVDSGGLVALFAAIFTALSPYVIETITWDACFHYILVSGLVFGALNCLLRFWKTNERAWLYYHLGLFFLALFTLELALVAPGIFVVYLFLLAWSKDEFKRFFSMCLWLIPVYVAFLFFYFLSTKWMIGTWVGHYGADQHMQFDPLVLISTFSKYFAKQLFFVHFWKFTWKQNVYAWLSSPAASIGFVVTLCILLFWMFKAYPKRLLTKVVIISFCAFVLGLLPVLNLFFVWIGWYENDRYSYFAAPHIYLAVSALIVLLFKKYYGIAWLIFIFINSYFLSKIMVAVNKAGVLVNDLSASFDYYDNSEVVLLCSPENTAGILLFRDYSDTGITLNESLDWLGQGMYKGTMTSLVQWNPTTEIDSLNVKIIAPNVIQVEIASWGTWFWRKGIGMTDFDNDRYKVTNNGLSFTVEVKDTVPNRVFIFNKGTKWNSIQLPIDENKTNE